jgi:acetyltransferase-like isoleucine patch superfamily enzyme
VRGMDEYAGLREIRKVYPGLRKVGVADAGEKVLAAFLGDLEAKLAAPKTDRDLLCRDVLAQVWLGADAARYEELLGSAKTPLATKAHLASFDPKNVTLEPEYYADIDVARYYPVKPLLWLWKMFDLSPLGNNLHFGLPFRRLIARHVFKKCGQNLKLFTGVEVSFGYNISVGDNVTVHRNVLLDDRGEIVIHDGTSISDYANIYSHSHDIVDPNDISLGRTEIGPFARVTYHSTILSGVRVGPYTMLGAHALATRPIKPYHIHVGLPAKSVRVKPNAPKEFGGAREPQTKPGERPTI